MSPLRVTMRALALTVLTVGYSSVPVAAADADLASLISSGESLRLQGKFPEARDALESAVISAADASPELKARAHAALGALLFFSREPDRAGELLSQALEESRVAGLGDVEAGVLNHQGMLAISQRDITRARQHFQASIAVAERTGDHAALAAATLNRARLERGVRKVEWLVKARAAAENTKPAAARVLAFTDAGRQGVELLAASRSTARGEHVIDVQWVYQVIESGVKSAESSGDQRLVSLAVGQMGALYESRGRWEDAMNLTRRSISAAEAVAAEDLGLRWQWQLGRLARAQGDADLALTAYRKAIRHIENVRFDIPVQYVGGRSSFRETLEPLYVGAADIMLLTSARATQATTASALLDEALYTMELLKAAEINDFFHDSCAARPASRELGKGLAPATAVLYPVILPERLELVLLSASGKQRFSVPVSGQLVKQVARTLASRLRPSYDGLQDIEQPARLLREWLVTPVEATLKQQKITTIFFVPDGPLRLIPLSALKNDTHYLVEEYAVATLPGLSQFDVAPGHQGAERVLLAGVSESVQGFERLPGVESELRQLGKQFDAPAMLNDRFSLSEFRREMQRHEYRIVHIASHGEFGGTPEKSFLLTYDRKLTMNDLLATLSTRGGEPIDLLSLSACHTAEGDDRAPLGLGGVAIKAGVSSALGSLWMVSDKAAERMIPKFYAGLEDKKLGKAEALRQAQLDILQQTDMKHPFFWAPFIIMGNAL